MKDLIFKYKKETGNSSVLDTITLEESSFIENHYLIPINEISDHLGNNKTLKIYNSDYVEWLEEKLESLKL